MKAFPHIMGCMRQMNEMINLGNTGPAKVFAAALKISERTLNTYLANLRSLSEPYGMTITYSTADKSYLYTGNGHFNFDWGPAEKK